MCYGDDARPPLPPISGAAADQGDIILTSSDGVRNAAYFARAAKPTGAGMVVMPDVRGLHHFYKELAQRFAEAGIDSVAIDYFARTAGMGDRSEGFEYVPHEQHVYEGAPHSFFDRTFEHWKDACDDAWRRMLDFVRKHGS